jgi:SNF2 family DNA or RNA helicase
MTTKSATTSPKVKRLSGHDWKPTTYMKRAVTWVLQNPVCALFLDPGLGKTSITLSSFKILQTKGLVRRMLVVAPLRVAYNVWPAEVEKWEQFSHMKVHVLHGKGKVDSALDNEEIDIYCINPEGLDWLLKKERFAALDCQMFVLDESSKFKNTQTKRFKLLKPFLPKFARRVILTGSPAPKNLLDLFGQIYIVDLGRALGQFITHYRNKYFDPSGYGGYTWVLKPGAEKLIEKAVKPYVMRLEAEDHIDMPQLVEVDMMFDLPPDARAIYEEMEDEFILELESGTQLSAPTGSAARGKCAQMASGAIYKNKEATELAGKKQEWVLIHDEKIEILKEYLSERNGQPTLIFYWFNHDLERIRKALGDIPNISDVSPAKGKLIEQAWNRNEIPVLLAHPASAGHGLNMQGGNSQHVFWFTLPDDFDIYDQANRRLRRSGNTNEHVFAHRPIARRTVDQAKTVLLRNKGKNQKSFLDAMKSYRSKPTRNK